MCHDVTTAFMTFEELCNKSSMHPPAPFLRWSMTVSHNGILSLLTSPICFPLGVAERDSSETRKGACYVAMQLKVYCELTFLLQGSFN